MFNDFGIFLLNHAVHPSLINAACVIKMSHSMISKGKIELNLYKFDNHIGLQSGYFAVCDKIRPQAILLFMICVSLTHYFPVIDLKEIFQRKFT